MRRPTARLSDKVNRTEPDQLRAHRGAALPAQTLVVYDPDTGLTVDQAAADDADADERTLARAHLTLPRPARSGSPIGTSVSGPG
ncbi:hypothetical protein VP06_01160 [Methylobacterium aquaticum]|uniref:Uncharacterized protein n=1 Tax=Methylobacterium aquaticum TaxID=270351 RepID=A0A0J6T6N8_9HYPH|nr:hypothetical protein VP06_01160 [Methylobacterium aquaticum]